MYKETESVILTDSKFTIEKETEEKDFSTIDYLNDIHKKYEDGYNSTSQKKNDFFESLIQNNN